MPSELVIVWRVTEQCNLGCHFCGYSRALNRPRRTIDPGKVLAFGKLLCDYRQRYQREVLVSWLGGEPFLWHPLLDVSQIFRREFGLRVAVTTNGLALSASNVRERVASLFDHIVLSIDGLADFHDRVRDSQGLFARLKANVIGLREFQSKLKIGANTVLMHDNVHQFESLCNQLADWGVSEITFNTLGGRDRPEFFPQNRLTVEDVAWLRAQLRLIRERLSRRAFSIHGSDAYLERIATFASDTAMPIRDCHPGAQFLFIDESGMIAPCNFTVNGIGVPIDQLHSVDDLQHLPAIFSARQKREPATPCSDCKSTQVFGKFV
ncbi:MAG: radical SAM protein [Chloroflexi bacterium]|nr:radical SAM protein [Chloroflexota bacterium]